MNAKADERKEERIAEVCEVYAAAAQQTDEVTFSVDEDTGIQSLERIAADLPMAPGKPEAREFEYQRPGTQTLIAAMRIATGKVYAHCGDTRTEADYCAFIEDLIQRHPGFRVYHLVMDQLNTHKSESLVRLTAKLCGLDIDLGVKGQHGLLKSQPKFSHHKAFPFFSVSCEHKIPRKALQARHCRILGRVSQAIVFSRLPGVWFSARAS